MSCRRTATAQYVGAILFAVVISSCSSGLPQLPKFDGPTDYVRSSQPSDLALRLASCPKGDFTGDHRAKYALRDSSEALLRDFRSYMDAASLASKDEIVDEFVRFLDDYKLSHRTKILMLLAEGIRENRHHPEIEAITNEYRGLMLAILDGTAKSPLVSRMDAMLCYMLTVLHPPMYNIVPRRDVDTLINVAEVYSRDSDEHVRAACCLALNIVLQQGNPRAEEMREFSNRAARMAPTGGKNLVADVVNSCVHWMDSIGTYDQWVDEDLYIAMKEMDEAGLLGVVRTANRGSAYLALEHLNKNWQSTTANFDALVSLLERQEIHSSVLRFIAVPVPEFASDVEKRNADKLIELLSIQLKDESPISNDKARGLPSIWALTNMLAPDSYPRSYYHEIVGTRRFDFEMDPVKLDSIRPYGFDRIQQTLKDYLLNPKSRPRFVSDVVYRLNPRGVDLISVTGLELKDSMNTLQTQVRSQLTTDTSDQALTDERHELLNTIEDWLGRMRDFEREISLRQEFEQQRKS